MTKFAKTYDLLMKISGVTSGLIIFFISILIFTNVILRNTGGFSWSWVTEICEYGLSFSAFLAAPWVLYESAHIKVDFLLHGSPEHIRKKIEVSINLIGLIIGAILFYLMLRVTFEAFMNETLKIKSLVVPEWWLLTAPVVCFLLICIEFFRRLTIPARGSS
ncbi:TRAP transporter small permease [Parasphingorhabdus sp.]|jgi:TRAP-type transport system small permease protein|uniref:TRAP transporter small permease n=2 Tax=Pseudomonadota TaxID=1224 RepID=UPI0032971097|tara:strand:- start:3528 stop:4013 length:486 start_codon:yes stop_codon:yes gene_type:complete